MTTDKLASFGDVLRRYRLAAGLTQEALAERSGLSVRGLSDLERGARRVPRLDTVVVLADALGLEPAARTLFIVAAQGEGEIATALLAPSDGQSISMPASALPAPPTALVGRERELDEVQARLRGGAIRLLTLTGPGGVGKTRLALHVAADLCADYADGVVFVALAPLRDSRLVALAIARSVGLHETDDEPPATRLTEYLHAKRLLLVLDNFEHVATAAPLVAELLAACPGLTVLATSRAGLHLRGEFEHPVPPLTVPPEPSPTPGAGTPAAALPVEALGAYAAVELFLQRARATRPDVPLTPATAPAIAAICRRLDGLPLAIELAAAWVKILPPDTLLGRLERRLSLLTGGAHDLPERQQTMRGTIAWSYDLLNAGEQALFRRLAVFAGGCTLEAVEAVCHVTAGAPVEHGGEGDVLTWLCALVDKSLLRPVLVEAGRESNAGAPRYTMLETIREYGWERLAASGEAQEVQRRHAAYYLALAEEAEPRLTGPAQGVWLEHLEAEHDNLRVALRRTLDDGHVQEGLRLAGALSHFWYVRSYLREGRRWLEDLLARADSDRVDPAVRAKALRGAGVLALDQGDVADAIRFYEQSLALYRDLCARSEIAGVLKYLGEAARYQGNYAHAAALSEESIALLQELGDTQGIAWLLNNLAEIERDRGDLERATALAHEALVLCEGQRDTWGNAVSLHVLSEVAYYQSDQERAATFATQALALRRGLGDAWGAATSLVVLGAVAINQSDAAQAETCYAESLRLYQHVGNVVGIAAALEGLASAWRLRGRLDKAALVLGAASALRDRHNAPLRLIDRAAHARFLAAVRASLGTAAFDTGWATGMALSPDQAVAWALDEIPATEH